MQLLKIKINPSYSTMSSFKFTSSLINILSFVLLLHTVFGANPIYQICSTSDNFTARNDDPYGTNLKKLMGYLSYSTPPSGFSFSSMGNNKYRPYGLALCRGDVSDIDCGSCVIEATSQVRQYCLYNKSAITWYDNCLVKYSNKNFSGQIDFQNVVYAWSFQNASDPTTFNPKARKLLRALARRATESQKMYAAGISKLGESLSIYGLVQCTRDLSGNDCNRCLQDAIKLQPECCDGKQGGRVMTGSCYFRYETYPFVKA